MTAKTPDSNTRSKLQAVKKLPTGIAGLDVVLHGGLPRGRTTALVGGPGGGKTSLCTNIAANCAGRGGACLYLSFEMSQQATTRDAASLGFDFRQLEKQGNLVFVDGRPVLGHQKRFFRILRTGVSCNEVDNQVFLFDVSYFHRGGVPSCPRVSCTMVSGCEATST